MLTTPRPTLPVDRTVARRWYLRNRNRTAEIFNIFVPSAYEDRPIPLRHPLAFYEGHIPAFTHNKLLVEALGAPPADADYQKFFDRGIDPASIAEAKTYERRAWPKRSLVWEFGTKVDIDVLRAIATADLSGATSPLLERGHALWTILEHEEMHHETFLYMLHRLPLDRKRAPRAQAYLDREPALRGRVEIPAGRATLGVNRDAIEFAWDNEFEEHAVDVGAFETEINKTTNGEWLEFVKAGGPVPSFWLERDGEFRLLGMFEELPLPKSWPAYVTQAQATEYAAWRGGRIMSEAEYHRAAYGTPNGEERVFPWGDAAPDSRVHGNFDYRRFDPEPVGNSPLGSSAFGIADPIGNGWEWTSTIWAPFPGFTVHPSYPQYSADFFDGQHYVMKGASPVTSRNLIRRSWRNWFRPDYPYVYATFRVVYD
jgi:formylglycine-generating enzyme required for sulfatase activity